MNNLRTILSLVLLFLVGYMTLSIKQASQERQRIAKDNTEINHIKYGLLSVHNWKNKVSDILTKKIREFDITTENRREIGNSIRIAMYQLISEVKIILDQTKSEFGWLSGLVGWFQSLIFDIDDLRERVPQFTEIILDELDNYETREKLRLYIQRQVDDLLYKTIGDEDLSQVDFIIGKYNLDTFDERWQIQEHVTEADSNLFSKSMMIVGLSAIVFLLLLIGNHDIRPIHFIILIGTCLILLYGGISTPMLEIDARISDFSFQLMGEPLEFQNQILFNQNKSILEVVQILLSTGSFQSILVGVLIFLFSVIFPVLKLTSSAIINMNKEYNDNGLMNWLAFKSGKWSMADVMVVAIFMAYIGFQGIIENQLMQLESITSNIEIITTDNSNLGVGFILFLSFCISSLILTSMIEKNRIATINSK